MNEKQIKELIEHTFNNRKKEFDEQKAILDDMDLDHPDYRLQSHMTSYFKGQATVMDLVWAAIK
tara:strand:+ start:370 stop:561 length:192 start_codon:yes stop_codon:yes gene_type:complete